MSTFLKDIKRNRLDYILTDVLPVELSELFTFRHFYEFLHANQKTLDKALTALIVHKNEINTQGKSFESSKAWVTTPLTFSIAKKHKSFRKMSLLQPLAAIQLYYFISCYQDEILAHLNNNSIYSLRFHKKVNELYYKRRKKKVTRYFSKTSTNLDVRIIEQTGRYFNLTPFSSLVGFHNSDLWYDLNLKYKYFSRIDYKSCFDSIYTHAFKWILSKDVNDSKGFKNKNLFTTIDRVAQNINAFSSNGIVVGPEFSRMIVELLLQHIDSLVYSELLNNGINIGERYSIHRFVDDIFIFTDTEGLLEKILTLYNTNSSNYLLMINERKIVRERLPFILSKWMTDTNNYSSYISNTMFCTTEEYSHRLNKYGENAYCFKGKTFSNLVKTMKRNLNNLVALNQGDCQSIISYVMGTVLNKFQYAKIERKLRVFPINCDGKSIGDVLDYCFYAFSFCPTFQNVQKLLSIISFINDDIELTKYYRNILQNVMHKYSYVINNSNMHDTINLLLFCTRYRIELPYKSEAILLERIDKLDDPIVTAVYLLYSKYNENYYGMVKSRIEDCISERLECIRQFTNILTHREFWWILIFNKCPHINQDLQTKFNDIITKLKTLVPPQNDGFTTMELFIKFLTSSKKQFFNWDVDNLDYLQQITYRTHERTLFQQHKSFSSSDFGSI